MHLIKSEYFKELHSFANKLAISAGKIILDNQKIIKILKYKDTQDIATSADIASEEFIINSIKNKYPTHSIYSEESGNLKNQSDFRWVIDPLDGTKEFLREIPLFNISIALEYKGELVVSCVYRPSEAVLYSAIKNVGSFKDRKQIKVSSVKKLNKSFVYCYLPSFHRQMDKYDYAFDKLKEIGKKVYRLRSLADENTALCWLAHGGIEAYLNLSNPPKWHDIASGLLIAKEAGAIIKDIDGKGILNENVETLVVANNKFIYNEIVKVINSV